VLSIDEGRLSAGENAYRTSTDQDRCRQSIHRPVAHIVESSTRPNRPAGFSGAGVRKIPIRSVASWLPRSGTDVETGPTVRCLCRGPCKPAPWRSWVPAPDHGVRHKLVANAAIHAPALDILSALLTPAFSSRRIEQLQWERAPPGSTVPRASRLSLAVWRGVDELPQLGGFPDRPFGAARAASGGQCGVACGRRAGGARHAGAGRAAGACLTRSITCSTQHSNHLMSVVSKTFSASQDGVIFPARRQTNRRRRRGATEEDDRCCRKKSAASSFSRRPLRSRIHSARSSAAASRTARMTLS
jgi:hypothetical protein